MPNLVNVLKAKKKRKYTKFAVVVSLILGIILFGIFSANLDSLRKPIIKELSQMTGLSIQIESLNISFSNGLSLRGSGLKVRSKDNSQEIFSAQNIFLNAKLKPLLKGQLKIRKIILVNPIMNVSLKSEIKPLDSPNIFKNMGPLSQGAPAKTKSTESSELTGTPATEVSLFKSLRNLFQNQNSSLRVIEVKNAELLLVRPKLDLFPAKKIPIRVSARLDLINPIPNQININGDLSRLEIEGLSFRGTLKANDLLAKETSVNVELESAPISVKTINTLAETLSNPESTPVEFTSGQIEKISIHLKGIVVSNGNPLKKVVIKSGFEIENLEISIPKIKKIGGVPTLSFIGAGNYAGSVLIPAFKKQLVNLKSIASSGGLSGTLNGKKFGFQQTTTDTNSIFQDAEIDTVVISTRHNTHAELVIKAIEKVRNYNKLISDDGLEGNDFIWFWPWGNWLLNLLNANDRIHKGILVFRWI